MLSAALVVPGVAEAAQLRGKGFYYGARDHNHVADLIEASLKRNPKGTSLLSESECRAKASCGSPVDYLLMFKEADPEGTADLKTVADVPAFVRGLREELAPKGRYIISCVRPDGKGFRPFLACLERAFKPGERVFVNPITGRPLLAGDCANPIKGPVFPKQVCAEIHFFARQGDTVVRHTPMGSPAFEDDCFAIRRVNETEFHIPWRDACASEHCTFAASEAFLKKKAWKLASYELEPGEYVVRVPLRFAEKNSLYVTVFCIERTKMSWPELPRDMEAKVKAALSNKPQEPVRGDDANAYAREYAAYLIAFKQWRTDYASLYDEMKPIVESYSKQRDEWIAGHSDSVNVWWNAYRVGNDGVPRATIYYTQADVPATETVKMYWRWGVWLQEHPQQTR